MRLRMRRTSATNTARNSVSSVCTVQFSLPSSWGNLASATRIRSALPLMSLHMYRALGSCLQSWENMFSETCIKRAIPLLSFQTFARCLFEAKKIFTPRHASGTHGLIFSLKCLDLCSRLDAMISCLDLCSRLDALISCLDLCSRSDALISCLISNVLSSYFILCVCACVSPRQCNCSLDVDRCCLIPFLAARGYVWPLSASQGSLLGSCGHHLALDE